MDTYQELWQNVLLYCKEQTNQTADNLWFAPIEMTEFNGSEATLNFANEFKKNTVVGRYGKLIEEAFEVMREIQVAAGLPFTAIVNNSNIGWETTVDDILTTVTMAEKLSKLSGLPILFTTAESKIAPELRNCIKNVLPLSLQKKYFDIKGI